MLRLRLLLCSEELCLWLLLCHEELHHRLLRGIGWHCGETT